MDSLTTDQLELLQDDIWNGYVIQDQSLSDFMKAIQFPPRKSDIFEFHNWYTMYTVMMMSWLLGHRAVRDPFCEEKNFNVDGKTVLINDKNKHGHKHLRMLVIPEIVSKQYAFYRRHLLGLLEIIENEKDSSRADLKLYLRKVLSGGPSKVKEGAEKFYPRLFFLLNRDGTKLKAITKSRMNSYFYEMGLPVPANFGRHHIATKLVSDQGFSHQEVQYFLGHSLKDKTKQLSERAMMPTLKKISEATDRIAVSDGWKSIRGFSCENPDRRVRFCHDDFDNPKFLPKHLPGYVDRVERGEDQEARIEALSEEICDYLDQLYGRSEKHDLSEQARQEIEQDFKSRIKGLDFPHHRGWSALKRYIREEFEGENPLPKMLKFNNLSSGVSLLAGNAHVIGGQCQDKAHKWSVWLNSSAADFIDSARSKEDRYVRLTTLAVISSVYLGGATRNVVTQGLANAHYSDAIYRSELRVTGNVASVEIFTSEEYKAEGEYYWEEKWVDRWIPDDVTLLFLIARSEYEGLVVSPRKVQHCMKDVLTSLGIKESSDWNLKKLPNSFRLNSKVTLPGFIAAAKGAYIHRRPLDSGSWERMLIGEVKTTSAEQSEERKKIVRQKFCADSSVSELDDRIYYEIERIINNPSNTRSKQAHRIEVMLHALSEEYNHYPRFFGVFFSWAIMLARRGMRGFSSTGKLKLKAGTIQTYIRRLYQGLFGNAAFIHRDHITAEEKTKLFEKIIDSKLETTYAKNMRQLLYMFDMCAKRFYGDQPCDWEKLDGIPIKYSTNYSGPYVSETEYHSALAEILRASPQSSTVSKFLPAFVAIMTYRFGLRPAEAVKLRTVDLLLNESGCPESVIIQRNLLGENKTEAGLRQVPLSSELSDQELHVIHSLYERAKAFGKFAEHSHYVTLSGDSVKRTNEKQLKDKKVAASTIVTDALRKVTKQLSVTTYSLRHSFATDHLAKILVEFHGFEPVHNGYAERDISIYTEGGLAAEPLKALSIAMGHSSTSVTLRTYSHCLDIVDNIRTEGATKIQYGLFHKVLNFRGGTFRAQVARSAGVRNALIKIAKQRQVVAFEPERGKKQTPDLPESINKISGLSIISVLDVLLTKSSMRRTNHTVLSEEASTALSEAINWLQLNTSLQQILDHVESAKGKQKYQAALFLESNHDSIAEYLSSKPRSRRLLKRLKLFANAIEPKYGKLIVLNKNEERSLFSVLDILGIDYDLIGRRSSRKAVALKYSDSDVVHHNHGCNQWHPDAERSRWGYQLDIKIKSDALTKRSLNLVLIVLLIVILASPKKIDRSVELTKF